MRSPRDWLNVNPDILARLGARLAEQAHKGGGKGLRTKDYRFTFTEFCDRVGITLTPGQAEIAAVAFEGHSATKGSIWGFDGIPPVSKVVEVVAGRYSGKSSMICGLRALHLGLTVDVSKLAKREIASIPIVAPDLQTAQITVRYALGAAETLLGEKGLCDIKADGFSFLRANGRKVRIEAKAASAGGKSIRGRSMPAAVMDECAFFRDKDHVVNDAEIFAALMPRIMPGGQVLIGSTPWTEKGLLFELWRDNYAKPTTALVAHAPTLAMRPDADTAAIVAAERLRDPVNARREYDAEFLPQDAASFFDSRAITMSVCDSLPLAPGGERFAGADFGFARDSSALVVVSRDGDTVTVVHIDEAVPGDNPLVPSEVIGRFAEAVRKHRATGLCADAHYREAVREHLLASDLALMTAPEGAKGKAASYALTKTLLQQGRLRLPRNERLIQQLKDITVRPTAAGGLSIQAPRWPGGGHGDIVSALVLAVWQSQRNYSPVEVSEPTGMDEHERREVERFEAEREELKTFELDIPGYLE